MSPVDAQWLHLVYRSIYRLELQSCWTDMKKIMRISIPHLPGAYLSPFCLNLPDRGKVWQETLAGVKTTWGYSSPASLCSGVPSSDSMLDKLTQSSPQAAQTLTKDKFLLSQGPGKGTQGYRFLLSPVFYQCSFLSTALKDFQGSSFFHDIVYIEAVAL